MPRGRRTELSIAFDNSRVSRTEFSLSFSFYILIYRYFFFSWNISELIFFFFFWCLSELVNCLVLQVYITTWLAEVNIDTLR